MLDYSTIRQGMDVFDLDGDKIGKVNQIHVPAGVTGKAGVAGTAPVGFQGVLHVDTGILGLGKDLWIPFGSISEIRGKGVFLDVDKDDVDTMGWDHRPNWLP